jgi:hypothetical protein
MWTSSIHERSTTALKGLLNDNFSTVQVIMFQTNKQTKQEKEREKERKYVMKL